MSRLPLLALLPLAIAAAAPVAPGDPALAGALREASSRLGADERTTFVPIATFAAPDGGRIVRLEQRVAGVPVLRGLVVARVAPDGTLRHLLGHPVAIGEIAATPRLTPAAALEVARGALRIALPIEHIGRARLVVSPAHGGRLAWDVWVQPALPLWSPHVVVDATTGEVLGIRDEARTAGGARVFADGPAAKAARRGDGSFDLTKLSDATLGGLGDPAEGANLSGEHITGFNCCPSEGCDGAKAAKQLKLSIPLGQQGTFKGDIAICDERPLAAADANGDFRFEPATEPTSEADATPGPSERDAFGEVMGYHHAEQMLAYMRTLDPAFELRAEGRPLRVTANVTLPDFREAIANFDLATFSTFSTKLLRFDNAAFIPAGGGIVNAPIPELQRDFDSIVLFQGTKSDFAYDPDVVSHELGHAVIQASGGLGGYVHDAQGVVPEPGALNEGLADYLAAARANDPKIGEYVGDLAGEGEGALRDLTNDLSCPDAIRGEVHIDSRHFSASLWAARTILGTDADKRKAFDQAVLAGIRSLPPGASFADATSTFENEIAAAFPANGRDVVGKEFSDRGVAVCDRRVLLDAATPVRGYFIAPASADEGFGNWAPGPVQFELHPPAGATGLTVDVKGSAGGGFGIDLPFGGFGQPTTPQLQALLKADAPIEFTYARSQASSDAAESKAFVAGVADADGTQTAYTALPADGACGEKSYFLALANLSQQGAWAVKELKVTWNVDVQKAAACAPAPVDAGTPDAGTDPGGGGDVADGCGCAAGPVAAIPALLALALRRRRRT